MSLVLCGLARGCIKLCGLSGSSMGGNGGAMRNQGEDICFFSVGGMSAEEILSAHVGYARKPYYR
jgi:hypothetical protein